MNSKKIVKKIGIVGSGPGGSAAAMLLASRGFEVDVFEKEPVIGGRSAGLELGPYRFDVGPTFLMMKYILDELFYSCDRKTSDYLDCRRLETMYRLQFDQKAVRVSSSPEDMKEEIERVFPGESEGLVKFIERESVRFERMYPCLRQDYGKLTSFVKIALLKAFPHVAAGRSLYEVLSDYFKSDELRLAFTFQSKYLGMSPWDCPGGFAMIPYTEHAHGIYHVMGGLSQITQAFRKVAEENGARFHVGTPVAQVLVDPKRRVHGLKLEDGRSLEFDEVVVNADFGHAMSKLFPKEMLRKWKPEKVEKKKFSCSTFMLYLGLDKLYDIDFHTILFSGNYRQNLFEISRDLTLSKDASIYIRNASVLDPSLAPAGHSALYVLAPVPNNFSKIDWDQEKEGFREQILNTLEKRAGLPDLRSHITAEYMVTPWDWEKKYAVYKGATFNLSHNISQMLYNRPHNEFEEFKNCYLVGGGTHPGSGLPTIFESARIATNMLCKKHGLGKLTSLPLHQSLKEFGAEAFVEA